MSDFPEFEGARSRLRREQEAVGVHAIVNNALLESEAKTPSPEIIRLKLVEYAATHLPDSIRLHEGALHAWVNNAYRVVINK